MPSMFKTKKAKQVFLAIAFAGSLTSFGYTINAIFASYDLAKGEYEQGKTAQKESQS